MSMVPALYFEITPFISKRAKGNQGLRMVLRAMVLSRRPVTDFDIAVRMIIHTRDDSCSISWHRARGPHLETNC